MKNKILNILHGINLTVNPGEVHAIMGPNGSGKSTLANVLAGREDYQVTAGTFILNGEDLLAFIARRARSTRIISSISISSGNSRCK